MKYAERGGREREREGGGGEGSGGGVRERDSELGSGLFKWRDLGVFVSTSKLLAPLLNPQTKGISTEGILGSLSLLCVCSVVTELLLKGILW